MVFHNVWSRRVCWPLLVAALRIGICQGFHTAPSYAMLLDGEEDGGLLVTQLGGNGELRRSTNRMAALRRGWLELVSREQHSDFRDRLERRAAGANVHAGRLQLVGEAGQECAGAFKDVCQSADVSFTTEAVVSTYDEDLAWLADLDDLNITVYVHDRSSHHRTHSFEDNGGTMWKATESQRALEASNAEREYPIKFVDIPNIGDEAAGYLQHIVTNYDNLPDLLFFLHGHRCSWHMSYDVVPVIREVRRCFSPSIGATYINVNHGPGACGFSGERDCYNISDANTCGNRPEQVKRLWPSLLQEEFGSMPETFCMDCCAQFAVSRAAIQAHPRAFYKKLLGAVTSGKTSLEYMWRLVLAKDFTPKKM